MLAARTALPTLASFSLLLGCAGPPRSASTQLGAAQTPATLPSAAAPQATPPDDAPSRRRFFADLVALVRRYHVFSPQTEKNLGRTWDSELPALEAELTGAADEASLVVALIHFGNSLHNPHCGFDPSEPATVVRLDAKADVEWAGGKPVFYVADAPKSAGLAAGDVIEDVNGVAASDLLDRDLHRTNRNNWFGVAQAVAGALTMRSTRTTPAGSHATWTVRARGGGAARKVELTWRLGQERAGGSDFAVDYARASCAGLRGVQYGPYALTAEGPNFCLYASRDPRYAAYPIVRYFSFAYFGHGEDDYQPGFHKARADHDALVAGLAAVRDAHAVLLDLRDNRGGSNPNWAMDWFAPAPYTDHFVYTRLVDELRDPAFRHDANMDDSAETSAFLAQLDARTPGQEFAAKRPFFCKPDGCDWDNRYTPSHRVTTLPVALLVGPDCVSSCDAFTQQFSEWGLGPLVGEPTATGHTTRRLERDVVYRGKLLGRLTMAFSYEVSGKTGERIEGVPIALTERVERTFANRDRYDQLLVDAAIAAVKRR